MHSSGKKKSKFSKLAMPSRADEGMDLESLENEPADMGQMDDEGYDSKEGGLEQEPGQEEPEFTPKNDDEAMEPAVLADASDDDLLAEIEKRGLSQDMGMKSSKRKKPAEYMG